MAPVAPFRAATCWFMLMVGSLDTES
jgi:hypothetical protein